MKDPRAIAPAIFATVIGAALWWAAALFAGACLGYAYPDRPWRWVLALFAGQFLAMCIRNGELGNLWPLGMLLFGVMALPGIVAAMLGARLKRRSG